MAKYYLYIGLFNCLLIYLLNRNREKPISTLVYVALLIVWPLTIIPAIIRTIGKQQ